MNAKYLFKKQIFHNQDLDTYNAYMFWFIKLGFEIDYLQRGGKKIRCITHEDLKKLILAIENYLEENKLFLYRDGKTLKEIHSILKDFVDKKEKNNGY